MSIVNGHGCINTVQILDCVERRPKHRDLMTADAVGERIPFRIHLLRSTDTDARHTSMPVS
jgi:hypothetical protein